MGFSQMVLLPRARLSMTLSWCIYVGVHMSTTSMSQALTMALIDG